MAVLSRGIATKNVVGGRRRKHHLLLTGDLQVRIIDLSILMESVLL